MASIIRYLWLGTRLTIDEVDALFALKHRKHERQMGNLIEPKDEPVRRAVLSQQPHAVLSAANGKQSQYSTPRSSSVEMEPPENELALDELVRAYQGGRLTIEGMILMESLVVTARAKSSLLEEKQAEQRRRLEEKLAERAEAGSPCRPCRSR